MIFEHVGGYVGKGGKVEGQVSGGDGGCLEGRAEGRVVGMEVGRVGGGVGTFRRKIQARGKGGGRGDPSPPSEERTWAVNRGGSSRQIKMAGREYRD
jgi:hypothetical protein